MQSYTLQFLFIYFFGTKSSGVQGQSYAIEKVRQILNNLNKSWYKEFINKIIVHSFLNKLFIKLYGDLLSLLVLLLIIIINNC